MSGFVASAERVTDSNTAVCLQEVNHHRTCGDHLQLCGGHLDARSGSDPGGKKGGQVHARECSVG